jgi:TetR/AcrR family transcriptional regulator, cholesterol catabolism regulator
MSDPNLPLVEDVRKLLSGYQSSEFTFKNLAKDLGQPTDTLVNAFGTEAGLVEEILNYEQQNLENIFSEFDFTGTNAIDGLLKVSKEISNKFVNILPSITFDLRTKFPEVRQKFVEKRISFVNNKIIANFEQGIIQGMYRPDLSAELVSRIYMSRLIDLHNPDFFPNESISFTVLFDVMFDTFIRGICSEEGKNYYEKKIKCMKF